MCKNKRERILKHFHGKVGKRMSEWMSWGKGSVAGMVFWL